MAHHLPCGELACGAALWRLLQLFPFDGLPDGCCRSVVAARAGVEGISMRDAPTAAGRVMYAGGPAMGIQGVAMVVAGECHLGKLPIGPRACPQSSVCPARPGTPQVLGFRRVGRELLRLRRTGRRPTYIQYETCAAHAQCTHQTPKGPLAGRTRELRGHVLRRYSTGRKLALPARPRLCSVTPEALNGSQSMKPRVTSRDVAPSRRSMNGRQMSSRDVEGTAGAARIDGLTSVRLLKRCACNSPTSGPWEEVC